MKIESELTRLTYIKINLVLLFRGREGIVLLPAVGILLPLAMLFTGMPLPVVIAFPALVFLIYSIGVISVLYQGRAANNRNFFLPVTHVFDDDGIHSSSSDGEGTTNWQAFIKWKKVAGVYLLYLSGLTFVAIQQSEIPDGRISEFEELISSKIPKKKRKRLFSSNRPE